MRTLNTATCLLLMATVTASAQGWEQSEGEDDFLGTKYAISALRSSTESGQFILNLRCMKNDEKVEVYLTRAAGGNFSQDVLVNYRFGETNAMKSVWSKSREGNAFFFRIDRPVVDDDWLELMKKGRSATDNLLLINAKMDEQIWFLWQLAKNDVFRMQFDDGATHRVQFDSKDMRSAANYVLTACGKTEVPDFTKSEAEQESQTALINPTKPKSKKTNQDSGKNLARWRNKTVPAGQVDYFGLRDEDCVEVEAIDSDTAELWDFKSEREFTLFQLSSGPQILIGPKLRIGITGNRQRLSYRYRIWDKTGVQCE